MVTGHVRLDTVVHLWLGWKIRRTPRVPHGPRTGILNVFHILWDPYGAVRDPQGCRAAPLRTRKGIDTTRIGKNPARVSNLAVRARTGPLRSLHGLFTGCLWYLNPYGARKLMHYNACIKSLRAPYEEAKFVRRRTGPVRAPWVGVRFLFKTAREHPARGLGVWFDWGISHMW